MVDMDEEEIIATWWFKCATAGYVIYGLILEPGGSLMGWGRGGGLSQAALWGRRKQTEG